MGRWPMIGHGDHAPFRHHTPGFLCFLGTLAPLIAYACVYRISRTAPSPCPYFYFAEAEPEPEPSVWANVDNANAADGSLLEVEADCRDVSWDAETFSSTSPDGENCS